MTSHIPSHNKGRCTVSTSNTKAAETRRRKRGHGKERKVCQESWDKKQQQQGLKIRRNNVEASRGQKEVRLSRARGTQGYVDSNLTSRPDRETIRKSATGSQPQTIQQRANGVSRRWRIGAVWRFFPLRSGFDHDHELKRTGP